MQKGNVWSANHHYKHFIALEDSRVWSTANLETAYNMFWIESAQGMDFPDGAMVAKIRSAVKTQYYLGMDHSSNRHHPRMKGAEVYAGWEAFMIQVGCTEYKCGNVGGLSIRNGYFGHAIWESPQSSNYEIMGVVGQDSAAMWTFHCAL